MLLGEPGLSQELLEGKILGERGLRGDCWESEDCMEIVVGVRNAWKFLVSEDCNQCWMRRVSLMAALKNSRWV